MPRTPSEATRFTSTHPHATSKMSAAPVNASTIDIASAPNPNETPAQKVARLREAARRARMDQETTWDRVVLRGRVWADRAHRVTTTALILSSVVAAGFAALSLGDMVIVNSRKKKDWLKEQEANYNKALALAREAEANGTLTDSLRMFLVKERALEQAEAEKKAAGTMWSRTKERFFGGLSKEDRPGGRLAAGLEAAAPAVSVPVPPPQSLQGQQNTTGPTRASRAAELSPETVIAYDEPREIKAADEIRRQLTSTSTSTTSPAGISRRGGPLDKYAENVVATITGAPRSWLSLITGR